MEVTYTDYLAAVTAIYGRELPLRDTQGGVVSSVVGELYAADLAPEEAAAKLGYWSECRKADRNV